MSISLREYRKADKEVLFTLIEKLHNYVIAIDPIKRLTHNSGYVSHALEETLHDVAQQNGRIFFA